jgi:hypothetical protein
MRASLPQWLHFSHYIAWRRSLSRCTSLMLKMFMRPPGSAASLAAIICSNFCPVGRPDRDDALLQRPKSFFDESQIHRLSAVYAEHLAPGELACSGSARESGEGPIENGRAAVPLGIARIASSVAAIAARLSATRL